MGELPGLAAKHNAVANGYNWGMPSLKSLAKLAIPEFTAVPGNPEREPNKREGVDLLKIVATEYRLTPQEQKVVHGIATGLTSKELSERLNINPNTVRAYLRLIMTKMGVTTRAEIVSKVLKHSALKQPEAGQHLAVESMIDRAIEVMGDRDAAMRWLGTPIRALDYATPISLLGTSEGATRVEDVLGRMEHGVW
jgi:putative toxin-antitoxin system antitoxin component (TIGR02293 family)